ncbi:MAG: hypothetical protein Sylvanvirus30_3 [Sylvanvirus sp.]|uniref:Uncharacterized protein n=1 Tax=Sylvanvirus sp. TaxID=2487774 RepID=A0A3G5AKA3_9VIRU|nr:MAG: hypothetical protein Sylvanvirus30_3 [Sylvanvirus sp.]
MLQAFRKLPSSPLPIPLPRKSEDIIALYMAEINYMLPPECPCLVPLARVSILQEFLYLRRTTTMTRGEVLDEIGFRCECCRSHYTGGLLVRHSVRDTVECC